MTPTTTTAQALPHIIADSEVCLKTRCPVTNDEVTVDKNTPSLEYKGQVYYFCCNNCPELFKKNPDKYAGK
jgi:YHS domain-containing protein